MIGVFGLCTVLAMVLAFIYMRTNGELRRVQAQVPQVQQNQARAQELAADVIEYSKTHPAVIPILQSVGAVPPSSSTAR